jgi:arylsulfatase A-like enzyme
MRPPRPALLAVAVAALLVVGCDGLGSARGSNVVLITIDALRPRNLGAYGYARETSPNIDALARDGALFQAAFAPSPWTVPSLGSLLTSSYPHQHLAHTYQLPGKNSAIARMRDDATTLAHVLGRNGYETAMFFQSAYPLIDVGLGAGFDLHQEIRDERTDPIRAWIRASKDRRFFVWIHFFKPHTPYFPSARSDGLLQAERLDDHRPLAEFWPKEECSRRRAEATPEELRIRMGFYDEAIRDSDFLVGEVVEELRRSAVAGRTLIALSADHGEEFFEHGGCDHGHSLYDELLHVPLVLWHPGVVPAGRSLADQVRTLDVAPTILELLEFERPKEFVGESLAKHLRGDDANLPAFSGFLIDGEDAVALRHDGFKYVHRPSRLADELYDLRADPGETTNLVESKFHPRLREMREQTLRWLEEGAQERPLRRLHLDAAERERLRALGYVLDAD